MGGIQSFLDEIALVPSQPFSLPAFLPKMTSTSMRTYITLVGKLLLDLLWTFCRHWLACPRLTWVFIRVRFEFLSMTFLEFHWLSSIALVFHEGSHCSSLRPDYGSWK